MGFPVGWKFGVWPRMAAVRAEALDLDCPPAALLDALADQDDPALLDSSALHEQYGRYTILACRPLDVLTLRDGVLRDRQGQALSDGDDESLWEALERAFSAVQLGEGGDHPPYVPGWIGYVGYEVGRHVEKLPGRAVRDTLLPDLRLAFYDALLVYDALDRRWTLVRLEFDQEPDGAGRAAAALRQVAVRPTMAQEDSVPAPTEQADAAEHSAAWACPNFSPADYQRAVARCVEYIAAGDIFQVNLSQRLEVPQAPPPLAVYRRLRRRNPAWYAADLAFDDPVAWASRPCVAGPSRPCNPTGGTPVGRTGKMPVPRPPVPRCAILSSSPELFLRVRGPHVITRPIKGTRRRTGDPAADQLARRDLLASPKDNAELAMIIDLLRNDLGRVCRYGSVRVSEPRRLETHPTVFHLVGTVEGELRSGVGAAALLRATFPGGSITGAPKIRAMEIIDELEAQARGVYTGCIGIVGVDGSCEWNIAIRTMVWDAGRMLVQAGGGILADSDPLSEYNETLDKARAMLEAIQQAREGQ